jgi:hypothetical protein
MEDGSSHEVDVCEAALATESSVSGMPRLSCLALWADESLRPTNPFEVLPA